MTDVDDRLVRKGTGQPRGAVLQQAKALLGVSAEHKDDLAEHGWAAGDAVQFAKNIELVEAAIGNRAEVGNGASNATSVEQVAIDNAKAFLRRLRNALPRALRGGNAAGVTMATFAVDDTLKRSTPKTLAYLVKIRPAVVAIDDALTKHFGGKKASEALDAVKTALEQADTDQEAGRARGPVETQALNEAVGRLLEDIEDLIRAGKSAFDGNAVVAAKFNKDIILRARRKKSEESEPAQPAQPPTEG